MRHPCSMADVQVVVYSDLHKQKTIIFSRCGAWAGGPCAAASLCAAAATWKWPMARGPPGRILLIFVGAHRTITDIAEALFHGLWTSRCNSPGHSTKCGVSGSFTGCMQSEAAHRHLAQKASPLGSDRWNLTAQGVVSLNCFSVRELVLSWVCLPVVLSKAERSVVCASSSSATPCRAARTSVELETTTTWFRRTYFFCSRTVRKWI